jgi:hypothetical protein
LEHGTNDNPGKNKAPLCHISEMNFQMVNAMRIAEHLFPHKCLLFIFDNSSAHNSLAKDALTVTKMNISPGGKNMPNMHDTIVPADNPHSQGGQVQNMQFNDVLPTDHPYKQHEGKPKGIRVILKEHGLISTMIPGKRGGKSDRLVGECKSCKASKEQKPKLDNLSPEELAAIDGEGGNDSEEEDEQPTNCCMQQILSLHPTSKTSNPYFTRHVSFSLYINLANLLIDYHCMWAPLPLPA